MTSPVESATVEPASRVQWLLRSEAVRGRRIVILDDDPTGTQTSSAVPVLTSWEEADIAWALRLPAAGFFVLTNTRAITGPEAGALAHRIVSTVAEVATRLGTPVEFMLRGDSTLRGHFLEETSAVLNALSRSDGGRRPITLFCPSFVEAGRVTIDDLHWVSDSRGRVPVAETSYAADPVFGFASSNLREWVTERSAGLWRSSNTYSVSLTMIREGGAADVAEFLAGLPDGSMVICNAETDEDIDELGLAALYAERRGVRIVYRCGPSLVRARLGQVRRPPLDGRDIQAVVRGGGGVLVVVGSHVALSTRQVEAARDATGIDVVAVDAMTLNVGGDAAAAEIARVVSLGVRRLSVGDDFLLMTSRGVVPSATAENSLAIAERVADGVGRIASQLVEDGRPRAVVAKGGITSHHLVTRILQISRGWVVGQMFDGLVSVLADAEAQQLPVGVLFPGNVGSDDALAKVIERLHR